MYKHAQWTVPQLETTDCGAPHWQPKVQTGLWKLQSLLAWHSCPLPPRNSVWGFFEQQTQAASASICHISLEYFNTKNLTQNEAHSSRLLVIFKRKTVNWSYKAKMFLQFPAFFYCPKNFIYFLLFLSLVMSKSHRSNQGFHCFQGVKVWMLLRLLIELNQLLLEILIKPIQIWTHCVSLQNPLLSFKITLKSWPPFTFLVLYFSLL